MKFNEEMLALYAVTDRSYTGEHTLYEQIEEALKGGATIIQLREKTLPENEFIMEAIRIKELCHSYNVPLIINDNINVALKSGADGVHVGSEDTPVAQIRKITPADFIIGATCKTVKQAELAEMDGADYMGVGAVFSSPTKTNAIRITNTQLREICSAVSIPAVAIGGINLENMHELKNCGIKGVAVVSAIFGAKDIRRAAEKILKKVKQVIILNKQKEINYENSFINRRK